MRAIYSVQLFKHDGTVVNTELELDALIPHTVQNPAEEFVLRISSAVKKKFPTDFELFQKFDNWRLKRYVANA